MKKTLLIAVALLALPVIVSAQPISATLHNFTALAWNDGAAAAPNGAEMCKPCHIPHTADITIVNAPLWNHTLTANTFTPYGGYDMDGVFLANPLTSAELEISYLCLSCHDGSVALDAFSRNSVSPGTNIAALATVGGGGSLAQDHPVGFTYDDALADTDGELNTPVTGGNGPFGGEIVGDLLGSTTMGCNGCHDVHGTATPAGVNNLLYMDNTASALCLVCHIK